MENNENRGRLGAVIAVCLVVLAGVTFSGLNEKKQKEVAMSTVVSKDSVIMKLQQERAELQHFKDSVLNTPQESKFQRLIKNLGFKKVEHDSAVAH